MSIEWDADARQLHLSNDVLSYVMRIASDGSLRHVYLGGALAGGRDYTHLDRSTLTHRRDQIGDSSARELPTAGRGDQRLPGITVEHADGSTIVDLTVAAHRITPGKPPLEGLPATYVERDDEAESVEIDLLDEPSGLLVTLVTTIHRDRPVVTRSLRLANTGPEAIVLTGVASAVLDLPDAEWHAVQLTGVWGRERHVVDGPLRPGRLVYASQVGSSGHRHDPSLIVRRPHATEADGEVIALALVYSGSFQAAAEVDPFGTTRLRIGIDPETFRWRLEPGESFQAPEAVLAWSETGLGGISDALHGLFRSRLARGPWRERPRPVVLNTWEAVYFDFDETRLLSMASEAKALGVELFVLDDGWFGRRDDATTSLGDWVADERKLPSGLAELARRVEELGMRFGIWVEPEMVSPRSELFDAHPDWAIGVPGRSRTTSRDQYVLDLSRGEVVDHLAETMRALIASAPISYVKWDLNRVITEPYGGTLPAERQGEAMHRHLLGVYELWRRVTEAFPDVLFEACASGGGRYDPGMLAYAPQVWTSDQTDPVERLRIQWGTSIVYPLSSMGAHAATSPGHVVGRHTSLDMRAGVAFFGAFGYELDPRTLPAEDRARMAEQIAWYLPRRELFQLGRFLRLRSPFEADGREAAWMVVDEAAEHAIVGWYRVLAHALPGPALLPLRGLDPTRSYDVDVWPPTDDALVVADRRVRGGDELMRAGLLLDDEPWEAQRRGDAQVRLFELRARPDA